jgi:mannose-6-phosphate isomerase-like protein (cupin superfamily)
VSVQVANRNGVVVTEGLPVYQEFDGHHGPAPMYLTPQTLPGTPISIAAVDAAQLVGAPHADLHLHDDHDEIYLCVTPGLRFAVELADDRLELTSPASVYIPAGVKHRLVVHEAATDTCPFLGILLAPGAVKT